MHRMKNGTFVIENVICGHWGALEREKYIKAWADYMRGVLSPLGVSFKVVIEQEPGSGGKESAESTVRNLAGHNVFRVRLNNPWVEMTGRLSPVRFCGKFRWIFEQGNGLA